MPQDPGILLEELGSAVVVADDHRAMAYALRVARLARSLQPTVRAVLVFLMACSTQAPGLNVDIEIVGANGRNPLGENYNQVKLWVAQPGRPVEFVMADASSGTFDVVMPLASDTIDTRVRVELSGTEPPLIGAPPEFSPLAAGGEFRIVVGQQGTCELLPDAQLDVARTGAAAAHVDTFGMLAGGTDSSGEPSDDVAYIDLLRMFSSRLEQLPSAVGPGRGNRLGDFSALLVHDGRAFTYDLNRAEDRSSPIELHEGAGMDSAVVERFPIVAVVGGTETNQVTWVAPTGSVLTTRLAIERRRPAAIEVDGQIVVAGGAASGPVAEVIDSTRNASVAVEGIDDGVRIDPLLIDTPQGLWLIGGIDSEGMIRTDTVLLAGCPDDCQPSIGPEWTTARAGVTYDRNHGLLIGGNGSTHIERIVDGPVIELHALLVSARGAPEVFSLESGMLVVTGGLGEAGARRDVEICFPWTLTPL